MLYRIGPSLPLCLLELLIDEAPVPAPVEAWRHKLAGEDLFENAGAAQWQFVEYFSRSRRLHRHVVVYSAFSCGTSPALVGGVTRV